jgi:membrane dipeptidase
MCSSAHSATPNPPIVLDAHEDVLLRLLDPSRHRTLDEPGWNGQANLANWREGGMNAIFFAVWFNPESYKGSDAVDRANEMIDCFEQQCKLFPRDLQSCQTADEVRSATSAGFIAGLLGIEGGAAINNDLSNIEKFRRRGVRYMTLTWRGNLKWAGSSQPDSSPPRHGSDSKEDELSSGGLTAFGRSVVHEMNRVGMVVDLSHVSDQTFYDAIAVSSKPVMVSHSNCRALSNHPRNVTDDMLRRIRDNNGVIGVNLWSELLEPEGRSSTTSGAQEVNLKLVLNQIDHMIQVAGIDHVGIGTDFEGMSSLPVDLPSAAQIPSIFEGMRRRGYSEEALRKFAADNFLRVLKANE